MRERLALYARTFRVGNLALFLQLGSMPHELTKQNIDRFTADVLPHLRPIFAEYDDANRWWPARLGGVAPSSRQAPAGPSRRAATVGAAR